MIGDKSWRFGDVQKDNFTTGGCSRKHHMWTPVLSPYHTIHEFVSLEVHFFRESLLSLDEASHICTFLSSCAQLIDCQSLVFAALDFFQTVPASITLAIYPRHSAGEALLWEEGAAPIAADTNWGYLDSILSNKQQETEESEGNWATLRWTTIHKNRVCGISGIKFRQPSSNQLPLVIVTWPHSPLMTCQPSRKSAPCPTCCRAMETMRVVASEKQQQLSLKFCQDCWQFATRLWHHPNYHPYHPFHLDIPVPWMWISHVFYWL